MKTMTQKNDLRKSPFDRHVSERSRIGRGLFLVLALCMVFLPATASAQGWWWGKKIDSGYDLKTVIDVKGIVTDTQFPEQGGPVSLSLRADNERYTVILGPAWYMKKQGMRVEKGDGLLIRGSRMLDRQGKEYVVAATVANERTKEEIRLRDENGAPLWSSKSRRGWQGERK